MLNFDYYEKTKSLSGSGSDRAVWTPATGKAVVVGMVLFKVTADCTVKFYKGTDTEANLVVTLDCVADDGACIEFTAAKDLPGAKDAPVYCSVSAGNISGVIKGWEVQR